MRVAIVAESFLPNVNGVSNSVLRILEHLSRTGHDAIVIAPDSPRREERAATEHDGVPVYRMPSRMFPKITSLPLGVPRPRMVRILREFDPDVVHLASPALLGYGGLQAARFLGVPTVAVFQTDVPGFAKSYGIPIAYRTAWAWFRHLHRHADRTLAPSTSAIETLAAQRIPRVHLWSRGVDIAGFAPSARDDALRQAWSPDGKPIVGFVGRLAPEKHVERLAALAHSDEVQLVIVGDGIDRKKLEEDCPQRFSPVRSTAPSSPRPTPAWTCSSTRASTKPSARPCRRRSRRVCPWWRRTRAAREIWSSLAALVCCWEWPSSKPNCPARSRT